MPDWLADGKDDLPPKERETLNNVMQGAMAMRLVLKNRQAERKKGEAERARLKKDNQELKRKVSQMKKDFKKDVNRARAIASSLSAPISPMDAQAVRDAKRLMKQTDGFMTRQQYRTMMRSLGMELEGTHVWHIIASSNGGPDHVLNYAGCLGGSMNMYVLPVT
jgi:hypothetical protein